MHPDTRYKILKLIHDNPAISQRDLVRQTGYSLGKINYCLKALIDKGFVKAGNFKNSRNRSAYAYCLTPKGIKEKTQSTSAFLRKKLRELEALKAEIEQLRTESDQSIT
jgi:EPS-associated MarR family transcriptional regulator